MALLDCDATGLDISTEPARSGDVAAQFDVFSRLRSGSEPRTRAALTDLIEKEIVPRLVKAHPLHAARGRGIVTDGDVTAFAEKLREDDFESLVSQVQAFMAKGICVEAMLLDLFTPVARELGRYWEEDLWDFLDVTLGLCRLQQVLSEMTARNAGDVGQRSQHNYNALFSAMPGDQHGFGAVIIAEMFARAGWVTDQVIDPTMEGLCDRIAANSFHLVGLTVSCDVPTEILPEVIRKLRLASLNKQLVVMVGGPVFVANPALADEVGADGTASNALTAVIVARTLVEEVIRIRSTLRSIG